MNKHDVNHPEYYNSHPSGIECIEIVRHYCFSIGNAIKYLWRCGLKQEEGLTPAQKEVQDLKKAIWYEIDRISEVDEDKYYYPKNGQYYSVLDTIKCKNPDTGDWQDYVLYVDNHNHKYARLATDFYEKFVRTE